jgi:serine protease Do
MIELSVAARNGDSGGPILNGRGELAGVLFGSAFNRTSGAYCGRLRWFLTLTDEEFRRISAQALLAQQSRRPPPPAAAINAPRPPAGADQRVTAANSPLPLGEGQGVRATNSPLLSGDGQGVRAAPLPAPPVPHSPPMVAVTAHVHQPPAAPPASIPAPPANRLPNTDQMKTILAAIGILAVLYHSLRLLGRAVG